MDEFVFGEQSDDLIFYKRNKKPLNKSVGTEAKAKVVQKNKYPKNLLDIVGIEFCRNRKYAQDFYIPYANVLYFKYQKFIELNRKIKVRCQITNQEDVYKAEELNIDPLKQIAYTSPITGDYGDIIYKYDPRTNRVVINIDYPNKEEAFVMGNLERICYKGIVYDEGTNRLIETKGFCSRVVNNKNNTKCENEYLYYAVLLYLTNEIVKTISKRRLYNLIIHNKEFRHPRELIMVAQKLREFVNTNEPSNEAEDYAYDIKKDTLLYDMFVSGNTKETKKIMDEKCTKGSFDLLNDILSHTFSPSNEKSFRENYRNLVNYMEWVRNYKKS